MLQKAADLLHGILSNFIGHPAAIDESHAMLIYGAILAYKPHRILECGIGQGTVSRLCLAAIMANQKGYLICVDNWHDWNGRPALADYLIERGADIAQSDQTEYIKKCQDSSFGMIISDADHSAEPGLIPEFLRIVEKNGLIFIHDTNNETFRSSLIKNASGLPYYVFSSSSLPTERCERGLLMLQKQ